MALIIGISGKARAGKDTLFTFLSYRKYQKYSFAEELKKRVRRDFKLSVDHTEGKLKDTPVEVLGGRSPRELLVDYGNLFRKYQPDYWVSALMAQLNLLPKDTKVAITDVRYPNEADAIKAAGGFLVRLERHSSREGMMDETMKSCLSEVALDDYQGFDLVLAARDNENPQDLEKFAYKVVDYVEAKKVA